MEHEQLAVQIGFLFMAFFMGEPVNLAKPAEYPTYDACMAAAETKRKLATKDWQFLCIVDPDKEFRTDVE